jgi:hypothetical protein
MDKLYIYWQKDFEMLEHIRQRMADISAEVLTLMDDYDHGRRTYQDVVDMRCQTTGRFLALSDQLTTAIKRVFSSKSAELARAFDKTAECGRCGFLFDSEELGPEDNTDYCKACQDDLERKTAYLDDSPTLAEVNARREGEEEV